MTFISGQIFSLGIIIDNPTMKFATLVIFACLKCVTVKSQGSLRVEDKSSNKAATAAELTQVDDPKTNDDAIVNADERAEADWGHKSRVREAMVCTPMWYINCDGVCVMSCPVNIGGSCGGLAKPWDTSFDKKSGQQRRGASHTKSEVARLPRVQHILVRW